MNDLDPATLSDLKSFAAAVVAFDLARKRVARLRVALQGKLPDGVSLYFRADSDPDGAILQVSQEHGSLLVRDIQPTTLTYSPDPATEPNPIRLDLTGLEYRPVNPRVPTPSADLGPRRSVPLASNGQTSR